MYSISYCSLEQLERCFFPVKTSPLIYEGQFHERYTCIGKVVPKDQPSVFLGLKKDARHFISNEELYGIGREALLNLSSVEPSPFYAAVNKKENKFHALITGPRVIDVLEYQLGKYKSINEADQLVDLLNFGNTNKNLKPSEGEFRAFLEEKFHDYFVGIIVRNGYDLDHSACLYFTICQYVSPNELHILSLDKTMKVFDYAEVQFELALFRFIGHYYQAYATPVLPEAVKPIIFDIHDFNLNPSAIKADGSLLRHVRVFDERITAFLGGKNEWNYSLFIDFILSNRAINTTFSEKEQWKTMAENYGLSLYYERIITRFEKVFRDKVKRKDYELGTMEFFERAWESISLVEEPV